VLGMLDADKVSSLWSIDGSAAKIATAFSVYSRDVLDVPVIVSTNSSSFVTGILWDTSDSADDEFDAAEEEDLVFITRYNKSSQGRYGIYGYEIRVPDSLDQYKGSDDYVKFTVETT